MACHARHRQHATRLRAATAVAGTLLAATLLAATITATITGAAPAAAPGSPAHAAVADTPPSQVAPPPAVTGGEAAIAIEHTVVNVQPAATPTPSSTKKTTPAAPAPKTREPASPVVAAGDAQAYARRQVGDDVQYACLYQLWARESGWNPTALNARSGAYGIPQALPGAKMASAGPDWRTNPVTQVTWGLGYIAGRYGTPCGAWAHFRTHGWY